MLYMGISCFIRCFTATLQVGLCREGGRVSECGGERRMGEVTGKVEQAKNHKWDSEATAERIQSISEAMQSKVFILKSCASGALLLEVSLMMTPKIQQNNDLKAYVKSGDVLRFYMRCRSSKQIRFLRIDNMR